MQMRVEILPKMERILNKTSIIAIIISVLFTIIAYPISLGIIRMFAKSAEPDPTQWGMVYVSTSPRAEKYHYGLDCEFLRRTTHDIMCIPVSDAEIINRTPCRYCLEQYAKKQYDGCVWYLYPIMLILFFSILVLFDTIRVRYVKKSKTVTQDNTTLDKGIKHNYGPVVERMTAAVIRLYEYRPGNMDKNTVFKQIGSNINNLLEHVDEQNVVDKETTNRVIELCRILLKSQFLCKRYKHKIEMLTFEIINNPNCNITQLVYEILDILELNLERQMRQ